MAKHSKRIIKSCLAKSGPKKGKVKPGFRLGKGGRCIAAKKKKK